MMAKVKRGHAVVQLGEYWSIASTQQHINFSIYAVAKSIVKTKWPQTNQVLNTLSAGQVYANAAVCSITI